MFVDRFLQHTTIHVGARLLLLLYTALALGVTVLSWNVLPFTDQWGTYIYYDLYARQIISWLTFIFWLNNEHLVVPSNIIFLIDIAAFKGTQIFSYTCLIAAQVAMSWAIWRWTVQNSLLWFLFILAMVSCPLQFENLTLPFNIQWPLSIFFVGTGLQLLNSEKRVWMLAGALLIAISVMTSANGLIGVAAGLLVIFVRMRDRREAVLVICSLIVLASVALFVSQYKTSVSAAVYGPKTVSQYVLFVIGAVGMPMRAAGGYAMLALGILGLMLGLFVTFRGLLVTSSLRKWLLDQATDPAILMFWFCFGTFCMIGIGRAGIGLENAGQSRYGTVSIALWSLLIGILLKQSDSRAWARLGLGVFAAIILGISTWGGQSFVHDARKRTADIQSAAVALRNGQPAENELTAIFPGPAALRPAIKLMMDRDLSIFAK